MRIVQTTKRLCRFSLDHIRFLVSKLHCLASYEATRRDLFRFRHGSVVVVCLWPAPNRPKLWEFPETNTSVSLLPDLIFGAFYKQGPRIS